MNNVRNLIAALAVGAALAAPLQARSGATWAEERFKSEVNQMVREVEAAPGAADKRAALDAFSSRMDRVFEAALASGSLEEADQASLQALRARFQAYRAELEGKAGFQRVADADLNRFASYIQQDLEQAQWGGGVYISAGALLVIVLLLVILL